jgi:hypothetical protein
MDGKIVMMFNQDGNRSIVRKFLETVEGVNLPEKMKKIIEEELNARVLGTSPLGPKYDRPLDTQRFLTDLLADALLVAISKPPLKARKAKKR